MLKIRRSRDRLIFNMGIPILVRRHLYSEMAPRPSFNMKSVIRCRNYHYNDKIKMVMRPSYLCNENPFTDTYTKWSPWLCFKVKTHFSGIRTPIIKTSAASQYKACLSRFRDSHYKDGTVMRPSCFHYGNAYTDEMTSLYWDVYHKTSSL